MTKRNLHQKLILYGLLVFFIWIPDKNYAQSVIRQCISSYGYVSSTTNIAINQTAGQCYFTTSMSENGNTVLQGFQQPVHFLITEESNDLLNQLDLTVYPNPTTYIVNIISQKKIEQAYINITDMKGKTVHSEHVNDFQHHSINCESWLNGTYFISVSDNNQKSKTVKLIISK